MIADYLSKVIFLLKFCLIFVILPINLILAEGPGVARGNFCLKIKFFEQKIFKFFFSL